MFFFKKFQNIWKMARFLNGTEGCNNLYTGWLLTVSFKKGFRYKTSRKTQIPAPKNLKAKNIQPLCKACCQSGFGYGLILPLKKYLANVPRLFLFHKKMN